ncbi:hypothetical protein [Streptomyces cellulosae]|uniref:hypothetical protein n=1 Tax=Streptomyces cellulosae TaxID=1968 RepID=UPI0004C6632A|nr:hypothetical protein [Streptomyces cellulosae]
MSAPPQARPNTARHADRNATIFNLRVAGLTVRQIAEQVHISPTRVQEILTEEIGARVGPAAEEYVTLREAELSALWKRTYTIMATAEDADTRLKAVDRLVRINESRRKLRGADAPEALTIALGKRTEEEAVDVVEAVISAVQAVAAALPDLDGTFSRKLQQYALEMAGRALKAQSGEDPGPEPEAPRPQLALPPGPSAPEGPTPQSWRTRDSADRVLDQLAKFEDEFGDLEDDDEG